MTPSCASHVRLQSSYTSSYTQHQDAVGRGPPRAQQDRVLTSVVASVITPPTANQGDAQKTRSSAGGGQARVTRPKSKPLLPAPDRPPPRRTFLEQAVAEERALSRSPSCRQSPTYTLQRRVDVAVLHGHLLTFQL